MEKKNNFDLDKIDFSHLVPKSNYKKPSEQEFSAFKTKVEHLINLDLTHYKSNQMERRINTLMNRNGIDNLMVYYNLLKKDPEKLREFINMLTINVTEFFRNKDKFDELEKDHLPDIIKNTVNIKVWSAGCSIGAEIYSLAMLLDKHGVLNKTELIASDFDKEILKRAQSGIYAENELKLLDKAYTKYFTPVESDNKKFQISKRLISSVKFERRDLLNSTFEKNFDLILCRNVVIYFTEEAKDELYQKFYDSLKPGGILFIGSTERINNYKEIGFNLTSSFFYKK